MDRDVERLKDEIAILEYRRGDPEALEGLIGRWQRRIFAYIRAVLADEEAAWDVSQEVWLSVVRALRGRTAIRCFAAWLYRLAHNKCITHLRRKGRLEKTAAIESRNDAASGEMADTIRAAEDAGLVREALARLPLPQREAITLFYLDDMSLRRISEILNAPIGTIQSRLHHGRAKLKAVLLRKGFGNE
ncbi:MAG: RNA polymerase sigma factor [Planctomycetota bacterium]